MSLGIVALVVFVLLAVALMPVKPKPLNNRVFDQSNVQPAAIRTLRQQHVDEEALAISSEYRRLADEAWLAELRQKASASLGKSTVAGK